MSVDVEFLQFNQAAPILVTISNKEMLFTLGAAIELISKLSAAVAEASKTETIQ